MKYGYARVSTQDQNLDLQIDALEKEGVAKENIFTDFISSAKFERKGLNQLLEKLQPEDVLAVWKLDRLGRSLKELINLIDTLKEKGVDIQSIQDKLDTTTPMGKLIFHINCAYAEFEREIIKERTKAGLAAARERGKLGGRPDKLKKIDVEKLRKLYKEGKTPIADLKKWFNISNNTLYRYVGEKA